MNKPSNPSDEQLLRAVEAGRHIRGVVERDLYPGVVKLYEERGETPPSLTDYTLLILDSMVRNHVRDDELPPWPWSGDDLRNE